MKLLIVRHGDPDYSIDSLTPKGWREAELLSCRPGSCAFSVQRRTRTEAGVVYEFTQSLIRADRVKLDIFLHKDGVSFTRSVDK